MTDGQFSPQVHTSALETLFPFARFFFVLLCHVYLLSAFRYCLINVVTLLFILHCRFAS